MKKISSVIFLGVFLFIFSGMGGAFAETLPPQWVALTTEQKGFLLEAFSIDAAQKQYWESLPGNMQQFVIDSIWKTITPEKQHQILLYAHIEKPFSESSDDAAKMPAPKWTSLTARQQGILTEAMKFDTTQMAIWNTAPNEVKQIYIDAVWPYIPTEKKQLIYSATDGGNTFATPTPVPTGTPTSPGNTGVSSGAPRWDSLTPQQQQALMAALHFDSTQQFLWSYMTPELKQMFIDYIWQYMVEDMKQAILAGDTSKVQILVTEQAASVIPPPQWNTLDPEEQQQLVLLLKLDPTLWNALPPDGKQFFLNTVWGFIPAQKQEEIIDAL